MLVSLRTAGLGLLWLALSSCDPSPFDDAHQQRPQAEGGGRGGSGGTGGSRSDADANANHGAADAGVKSDALEQPALTPATNCAKSLLISYLSPTASTNGFPSAGEIKIIRADLN